MSKQKRFGLICAALAGFGGAWMESTAMAKAEPATQPVTVALGVKPPPSVEVFPFTAISNVPVKDWTGRGIQENLQSDVSRTGATLVLPANLPCAADDAIASARQNHADLAVIGTYQIVGDQIRANGHLIEVSDNKTVGGFSATGSQQDLFKVEDALGEQLRALLPGQMTAAQIRQAFDQHPPLVEDQQPNYSPTYVQAPDYSPSPPTVNNYYDTTPVTPYYYPDYDGFGDYPYAFGFCGGGGYVYGGRGYGYHDHGFSGRGYSGHFGGAPAFRGGGFGGGFHGRGGSHGGAGGFHGGGGGHR